MVNKLSDEAIELLQELISTQSYSKEEDKTAEILCRFFSDRNIKWHRSGNNVWAMNRYYDEGKPTVLLNSHHDTVKPNSGYTRAPFDPSIENGVLFGLGSNDAGGCLVSLIVAFVHFYSQEDLKYNIVMACSAEEEISGKNGIAALLPQLPAIDFAIVGEPTEMNAAISEKGLMVLDCVAMGKSGHAAREEGVNAIYEAINDINWFRTAQLDRVSETLGPVKMSVTMVNSGTQHNVVPDRCEYVVDVRTTDAYSNQDLLDLIKTKVSSEVTARSTRLNPSSIDFNHPVVQAAIELGATTYGSPTLSDQALMTGFPSLKMGPGKSERSHTADEFVLVSEIEDGVSKYIATLEKVVR